MFIAVYHKLIKRFGRETQMNRIIPALWVLIADRHSLRAAKTIVDSYKSLSEPCWWVIGNLRRLPAVKIVKREHFNLHDESMAMIFFTGRHKLLFLVQAAKIDLFSLQTCGPWDSSRWDEWIFHTMNLLNEALLTCETFQASQEALKNFFRLATLFFFVSSNQEF